MLDADPTTARLGLSAFPGDDATCESSRSNVLVGVSKSNDVDAELVANARSIKAQLATVEDRLVVKKVGTLSAADRKNLDFRLRGWLQL